jgi:hypothetical protein
MNWAIGSAYPHTKRAGPFHLLAPFPKFSASPSRESPEEPLPDGLPDYLVYVTRKALLATTTSLTKAATETRNFFGQLCQFLAFERFMRSVAAWWMPGVTPFYMGGVQPWMMPAAPQPSYLPFWGTNAALALPKPQSGFSGATQPFAATAPAPDVYSAMMAMPAAFFAFTPMFLDSWRLPF